MDTFDFLHSLPITPYSVYHWDCLTLANWVRLQHGLPALPNFDFVYHTPQNKSDYISVLLQVWANPKSNFSNFDLVCLVFNREEHLGTYYNGFIIYMGNSCASYRPLNRIAQYIKKRMAIPIYPGFAPNYVKLILPDYIHIKRLWQNDESVKKRTQYYGVSTQLKLEYRNVSNGVFNAVALFYYDTVGRKAFYIPQGFMRQPQDIDDIRDYLYTFRWLFAEPPTAIPKIYSQRARNNVYDFDVLLTSVLA